VARDRVEKAVTELKLDVPNDDFWFYELEFKRK
jgi:fumarate reductase subunit D